MNELTEILADATAHVGPEYFRLPIDGGGPLYRERVYCYELYHQMRLRWPLHGPFMLNGEVDKSAHPILSTLGASYAKPDLLVHGPGHMSRNYAIIEVKSLMARREGVQKDLNTLSLFRTDVRYERAVYLIYVGESLTRMFALIERCAADMQAMPPIEVWGHARAGRPAEKAFDLGQ